MTNETTIRNIWKVAGNFSQQLVNAREIGVFCRVVIRASAHKTISMLFLLLSILCSTAIVLLFRQFAFFRINAFSAITVNYGICVFCAWAVQGRLPLQAGAPDQIWFPYAIALGFVLISGFNLIAATVRTFSVTVGAVMQKMSLVLTVLYTILFYDERVNTLKIIGILAALGAIVLINWPQEVRRESSAARSWYLYLIPFLAWIMSAAMEILLFRVERLTGQNANLDFLAFLFGTAFVLGILRLLVAALRQKIRFRKRDLFAGLLLGMINFGSIYFLLRTLGMGWEGSVVFPVNNVSIMALSALLAYWLFREKLGKINILGLALALSAIVLIAMA